MTIFTLNQDDITLKNAPYDRLVIMVVDALRYDFVYNKSFMPFVSSHLSSSRTLKFILNVDTPTVTLPRIKVGIGLEHDLNRFNVFVMFFSRLWLVAQCLDLLISYGILIRLK